MSENVIVTGEFVKNAKHLYRTAIHATKAWHAYVDAPTIENAEQVGRHFRLLCKALARIAVDAGFPAWRKTLPDRARLDRETAWRKLDPKYYALAQKFTGRDNYADAHCVRGQTHGPVVFYNILADEGELNTAVVMPLREV